MGEHELIDLNTIGYRLRTEFGIEHTPLPAEIQRLLDQLQRAEREVRSSAPKETRN